VTDIRVLLTHPVDDYCLDTVILLLGYTVVIFMRRNDDVVYRKRTLNWPAPTRKCRSSKSYDLNWPNSSARTSKRFGLTIARRLSTSSSESSTKRHRCVN